MVFLSKEKISPVIELDGKTKGTDLPRQLLPKAYELNGNVDAFRIMAYKKYDSFFPEGTGGYIQLTETADINYDSDLKRLRKQNSNKKI